MSSGFQTILPGATLGMLGSGQLGRMFAIAARRLGYRVHVLSPDSDSPTGQIADREHSCAYDDLDGIERFAKDVDVVSFEFENVPSATVEAAEKYAPVRPGGQVLHTTQHRLREKTFLEGCGIPVTPFLAIRTLDDLHAVTEAHVPGILKTAASGYDGKGQVRVESLNDLESAWNEIDQAEAILERLVDLDYEISVVAARAYSGEIESFGPMRNDHSNHILDLSVTPISLPAARTEEALDMARTILERLDVVGVLCVEFFVSKSGELLVNELAPRPHNSGHHTVDAFATCQFEQQVRGICGLPLGQATQLRPTAMANLLGDLWENGEPKWDRALAIPDVKLHLYGKREAKPGRKMGHLTALADSTELAAERALAARKALVEG